jgi:hypothetical protein
MTILLVGIVPHFPDALNACEAQSHARTNHSTASGPVVRPEHPDDARALARPFITVVTIALLFDIVVASTGFIIGHTVALTLPHGGVNHEIAPLRWNGAH